VSYIRIYLDACMLVNPYNSFTKVAIFCQHLILDINKIIFLFNYYLKLELLPKHLLSNDIFQINFLNAFFLRLKK
jgi:hypothetical protein